VSLAPVFVSLVLVLLAAVAFWQGNSSNSSGVFTFAGVVLLAVAAIPILQLWITMSSAEFAVTNKRVIFKTGFIQKKTAEMFLAKIESVAVDQSIAGRMMGYGTNSGTNRSFAGSQHLNSVIAKRRIDERT
jgi:uncharacterized membrane protein YdbT with pleckstrin-like domain